MLNTIVASRAVLIRNCNNQPVLPDAKPADWGIPKPMIGTLCLLRACYRFLSGFRHALFPLYKPVRLVVEQHGDAAFHLAHIADSLPARLARRGLTHIQNAFYIYVDSYFPSFLQLCQ